LGALSARGNPCKDKQGQHDDKNTLWGGAVLLQGIKKEACKITKLARGKVHCTGDQKKKGSNVFQPIMVKEAEEGGPKKWGKKGAGKKEESA